MDALFAFASSLWDHWYALIGVLLMVEPLLDYYFDGFRDWADKYISRKSRTRIAITISVMSVIICCFLAFVDQYRSARVSGIALNGTGTKPGYVAQLQVARGRIAQQDADINGHDGYKQQIAGLEHNVGKAQDEVTFLQNEKPQVVVQTKEVPVVIPSGATLMTPEQEEHAKRLRIALATFISEGTPFLSTSVAKGDASPEKAANEWYGRLVQYLDDNLDHSYVVRLDDNSDIPSVFPTGTDVDLSNGKKELWTGVHNRIYRLNEFIRELSK